MQSLRLHSLASQFKRKQRKILVKKYEWIKELGEGAYGQVVLCKNLETEDIVAVKMISIDIVQRYDKVTAVFRERDLLYELTNPFIIKLLTTKKVSIQTLCQSSFLRMKTTCILFLKAAKMVTYRH